MSSWKTFWFFSAIHEVRLSDLPSARLLSSGLRTLYYPINFESNENLHNDFIQFFLAHVNIDIVKTLKSQTWNGNYGFECCDCGGRTKISERFFNHHCMPIEIPDRDPIFRGQKCMNYIRAMVSHDNCQLKEATVVSEIIFSSKLRHKSNSFSSTQSRITLILELFTWLPTSEMQSAMVENSTTLTTTSINTSSLATSEQLCCHRSTLFRSSGSAFTM